MQHSENQPIFTDIRDAEWAAERLGTSRRMVYHDIRTGKIPEDVVFRRGSRVQVLVGPFEDWIANGGTGRTA